MSEWDGRGDRVRALEQRLLTLGIFAGEYRVGPYLVVMNPAMFAEWIQRLVEGDMGLLRAEISALRLAPAAAAGRSAEVTGGDLDQ